LRLTAVAFSWRQVMKDVVFVMVTLVFFLLSWAYVAIA
jgi:hypothetical protein